MGADFCIMTLDWKQKAKNESTEKGFLRTCKEMDGRINKIKRMPASDLLEDVNPDWHHDANGTVVSSVSGNKIMLSDYKDYVYSLVNMLRDSWGGRDNTVILVGNHFVFITGGMTWGDSPGDTFDVLVKLNYAGVL